MGTVYLVDRLRPSSDADAGRVKARSICNWNAAIVAATTFFAVEDEELGVARWRAPLRTHSCYPNPSSADPHKVGPSTCWGAETTDPKSITSIAAQAVKKHRITRSGLNILNRLVFYSISFGSGHCAAVTDTGLIYTWGQGRYGQLGHGDEADKIVPQPVRGITGKVKAVSASFYHNLAVTVNGHVFSWGMAKKASWATTTTLAVSCPLLCRTL